MLKIFLASICFFLLSARTSFSQSPTYVVLWFDTEDYVDPIADDAALRIANDLTSLGIQATFKIVGEKARVIEHRGRTDVIQALGRHCIGYHSDWHSIQPVPALNLQHFGFLEGAQEFERRQRPGFEDLSRIFGVTPACYGQPGSSWAPQSNLALRRMGIHVYLDSGNQIGYHDQPIWFGGLLYAYNMGPYQLRADLDHNIPESESFRHFDEATKQLRETGGGLISIYYHPTELVHTEFWDAVNFAQGAVRKRDAWVLPRRRTSEDAERCFQILKRYVEHAKSQPGVQFVTANDLLRIYANPTPPIVDKRTLAQHFSKNITFLSLNSGDLSAADILLQLLDLPAQYVDGPLRRGATSYTAKTIPDFVFASAISDVKSFIETNHYLPSEVFVGSQTLSLADFAATLSSQVLSPGSIRIEQGHLAFEQYVSTDAHKSFSWPIHPPGFAPDELLDMARLQAWTLKPARLR